MKKIAGILLVVVAIVVGSFYCMGLAAEKKIHKDILAINETNGVKVAMLSYQRGWFSSKAVLDWTLHIPQTIEKSKDGQSKVVPAQDIAVTMPVKIFHGPIIIADKNVQFGLAYAKTTIAMPDKFQKQLDENFIKESSEPALKLGLFIRYLGRSTVHLGVPSFVISAKDGGERFIWKGIDSNIRISPSMDKIVGEMAMDGFHLQKRDTSTDMGEVETEYQIHKDKSGLFVGDFRLSFPSLVVKMKQDIFLSLHDFDFSIKSNVSNNLYSSESKQTLDKLVINNSSYGPGKIETSLKNLNAVALAKIVDLSSKSSQGTAFEKQKAYLSMLPLLPDLLNQGAAFQISSLDVTFPQGKVQGSLLISVPKNNSRNPFELLQNVQGEANVRVSILVLKDFLTKTMSKDPTMPYTAEERADKQIKTMLDSGFLLQQGEYYHISIKLEKGSLLVNGKPFQDAMLKPVQ